MDDFYGNRIYPLFSKWDPFSNHYWANFELHSEDQSSTTTYNCTEQFLFAERAKACKDLEALKAIMNESEPRKIKQMGDSIEVGEW